MVKRKRRKSKSFLIAKTRTRKKVVNLSSGSVLSSVLASQAGTSFDEAWELDLLTSGTNPTHTNGKPVVFTPAADTKVTEVTIEYNRAFVPGGTYSLEIRGPSLLTEGPLITTSSNTQSVTSSPTNLTWLFPDEPVLLAGENYWFALDPPGAAERIRRVDENTTDEIGYIDVIGSTYDARDVHCKIVGFRAPTISNDPTFGATFSGEPADSYLYGSLAAPITDYPFTIECWAKQDQASPVTNETPFGVTSNTSSTVFYNITFNTSNGVTTRRRDGGSPVDTIVGLTDYEDGEWHKYRVVFKSATEFDFYFDNVLHTEATGLTSIAMTNDITQVNIGNLRHVLGTTGSEFHGDISQCKLWVDETLTGDWQLNGDATDSSGNSQDLTTVPVVTYF